tara:strand:- start:825 stop:1025 length:201 start_codon:yes stop_codon:yes gene_type:complete
MKLSQEQIDLLYQISRPSLIRRIDLYESRLKFLKSLNELNKKQTFEQQRLKNDLKEYKTLLIGGLR